MLRYDTEENIKNKFLNSFKSLTNNDVEKFLHNKAIFFNEISYNSINVRKSIGLPEVYDKKNKSKYGDGIYNNFKILYTRETRKIEFTNIVNNYSKILKKIICCTMQKKCQT